MSSITQSQDPPKVPTRDVEDFLNREVSVPLCLRKLSFGLSHHQPSNNPKRGSNAAFSPKFDTNHDEIHLGDFLSTLSSYNIGPPTDNVIRTPDRNIKHLVDQALETIYDNVGCIVSFLLDQFEDPDAAHRVFVERTHTCRKLTGDIQQLSNHAYELGRHSGREEGLQVIRKLMGTKPTSARIYKFATSSSKSPNTKAFDSHRRVGVSVQKTEERLTKLLPDHVENARVAWESVEEQIGQLALFQLRCILDALNVDEDAGNKEDVVEEMYRRDLTEELHRALNETFFVGSFDGYHVAQERYKNLYGISNPWTYSLVEVNSNTALIVSTHSRVIPKVALKSFSKRHKKI